jgi:hypothetical protein
MEGFPDAGRPASGDQSIVPVTIFDAPGHIVRVGAAADSRRAHPRVAAFRYRGGGDPPPATSGEPTLGSTCRRASA